MSHPLFIEDGYTVTETIPAHKAGWYPEFDITYRPCVGEAQKALLHLIRTEESEAKRTEAYQALVLEYVSDIAGRGVKKEMFGQMHEEAFQRMVNRVLVIDNEVRIKIDDAAKN